MIKKYIENVKQRSHVEKTNFAFMASAVLTGLIAAVWILAILISPSSYIEFKESDVQALANSGSLFDTVTDSLKSLK